MELRGDLHVHTCRSPDSDTTLEQALSAAKAADLDFLALTDHNLAPDPSLFPAGRRQGILVIPGVEYSTDRGHLLGLFLERPCPPAEEGRVTFSQAVAWIRQSGGLAVLAHPFQSTAQTVEERMAQLESLSPQLDGLEVCNRRATKKRRSANSLAEQAKARFLPQGSATAGSDAHSPQEIGTAVLTVTVEEPTPQALRQALTQGAPCSWKTAPCGNRLIAKSQRIMLRKTGASPKAYARWLAFWGLCLVRDLKQKRA